MSLKLIVAFQVAVFYLAKMNGFMATPDIAQLVGHVFVHTYSNQIVAGSISAGRIFGRTPRGAGASVTRTAGLTHRHARRPKQHVRTRPKHDIGAKTSRWPATRVAPAVRRADSA